MQFAKLHHVGLWVDDVDAMITFLVDVMGLRLLTRNLRGSVGSGERIFVEAGEGQLIEILTASDVQPRPEFAVHPVGRVVGVPHLCLQVTDLHGWCEKLNTLGYAISGTVPELGYMESELGHVRLAWFEGPSGIGIELFEFEE